MVSFSFDADNKSHWSTISDYFVCLGSYFSSCNQLYILLILKRMLDSSSFIPLISMCLQSWITDIYIEAGHDFYLVTNKQSISTNSLLHCLFTSHVFLSQKYSGKMSPLQLSQPSPPFFSCYSWVMLLLPTFYPTGWTDQHHPWCRASLLCWSQKSDFRSSMISHASIWQWILSSPYNTFTTLPSGPFSLLNFELLSFSTYFFSVSRLVDSNILTGEMSSWVLCAALFSF